jgi:hypothetical protein
MPDEEVKTWLHEDELKHWGFQVGARPGARIMLRTIAETRKALRLAYGHDVYEYGCPECKRGAPHTLDCFIGAALSKIPKVKS